MRAPLSPSLSLSPALSPARRARWFFVLSVGAGLVLVALLAPADSARAHDQVIATAPAEGEELDAAPTQVTMTFTSDVLEIGAIMLVVDASGTDWAVGAPALKGVVATQAVSEGMPDGAYEVRWRVVSADGHPISDTIDFTVAAVRAADESDGPVSAAPVSAAPLSPAPVSPAPPPATGADETGRTDTGTQAGTAGAAGAVTSADRPRWLTALIGASVGIAVYLLFLLWRRPAAARVSSPTNPLTAPGKGM